VVPVLAMGVFERVGSNWFGASLRREVAVFNEPFRQQLHPTHPLSPCNPHPTGRPATGQGLGLVGHWLEVFVASKLTTAAPVVVKETNLFFATGAFLGLFPASDVVVLCRDLVGILSSFRSGQLYRRWDYDDRYEQVAHGAVHGADRRWSAVLCTAGLRGEEKLIRLALMNTVLLVEALGGRRWLPLAYEDAVCEPARTRAQLAEFVPEIVNPAGVPVQPAAVPASGDDVYSPHRAKSRLEAELTAEQITAAREVLDDLAEQLGSDVAAEHLATAVELLHSPRWPYRPADRTCGPGPVPGIVAPVGPASGGRRARAADAIYIRADGSGLWWRTLLVTNEEFCGFLNEMRSVGVWNVVDGAQLLCNETMVGGRGGRVHLERGRYVASTGFADHPVYWVTWLGAALFAACAAARLPTRGEVDELLAARAPVTPTNVDFAVGDTTGVIEAGRPADAIHHLAGNVQVWCQDGPGHPAGLQMRHYHGVAWNSRGDIEDLRRLKARHVTASSRGIGIRLVRDTPAGMPRLAPDEIARRVADLAEQLDNARLDLAGADRALAALPTMGAPS
jgi:hypothetical protein